MTAAAPIVVGPIECDLLTIARALVSDGAYTTVQPMLASSINLSTLGPRAMGVLKDTIAKGTVKMLARLGGARMRTWSVRHSPNLKFSPYTFELIRWLAVTPLGDRKAEGFEANPKTVGDQLMAYFTMRLVEGRRFEQVIASQPGIRAAALAWLGYASTLARFAPAGFDPPPFNALVIDQKNERGSVVVECLIDDLRRRWVIASSSREDEAFDAPLALQMMMGEQNTLGNFVDLCAKENRWELTTFLVEAGARLLPRGSKAKDIANRAAPVVNPTGPLRARSDARRKSGAVFYMLRRISEKREELALIRFFEDTYQSAQVLLAAWDVLGKDGFARAEEVIRELDALPGAPTTPAADAAAT